MTTLLVTVLVLAWILIGWWGGAMIFTGLQRHTPSLAARDLYTDALFLPFGLLLGPITLLTALIEPPLPLQRRLQLRGLLWTPWQARREIEAQQVIDALARSEP